VSLFASDLPATDVQAHVGHYVATLGFFVPAAILIGFVVFAVVRDRRLSAREAAEDDRREGMAREEIPTPPPAD
jgi:flagellar biosynthesis/type III secretory pathway M-ring protein FliF/YscJ